MIKTIEELLLSAKNGDAESQYELGIRNKRGENIGGLKQERRAEAYDWFAKAAQNGHTAAAYEAGMCCLTGEGTAKSALAAQNFFIISAQKNNPAAQYELGELFFIKKDYFEAVKWFSLSAKTDNWDALKRLAECYKYGLGIVRDEIKSKNLIKKADELYNAEKIRREKIGNMSDLEITEYDLTEKYNRNKTIESVRDLARFYLNNERFADAKEWAETGYIRADAFCTLILAQIYEKGLGTDPDIKQAKTFYLKAVSFESAQAAATLAQKFLDGAPGFSKSKGKAVKYLTLAVSFGDSSALATLSRLNPKLAAKLQKK